MAVGQSPVVVVRPAASAHSTDSARQRWLHIAGLWALVVAYPLLDLIGRNPDFLIAYRAGRVEVAALTGGLVLLCPALLVLAVSVVGLAHQKAGALAVDTCIGALVALFAMQVGRQFASQAWVVVPPACLAGAVAGVAYHRRPSVRTMASALAASVVVVPVLFWWQPAVRHILTEDTSRTAAATLPARADPVPVVMIVFDELSLASLLDGDGTLDSALYPNLGALARDGVWFRNATTVSDYTRWALPAIVTRRWPDPELAPSASDHSESLFSLLSRTHRVHAHESVTALCPDDLCGAERAPLQTDVVEVVSDLVLLDQHIVLTEDLTRDLPDPAEGVARFGSTLRPPARRGHDRSKPTFRSRMALIDRFVEDFGRDAGQPGLFFLHSMLSHSPSWLLPSGQVDRTRVDAVPLRLPTALPARKPGLWPNDDWAVVQTYQRYLLQLGFVDAVVGRLVARLKAADMYDRSLVMVLSDHGAAFRPQVPRRHFTEQTAAEIMRIPLILKLPAGSPWRIHGTVEVGGLNVNDRNVETIDLVPTIATVLGIRVPWRLDGASMVDGTARDRATKVIYYQSARRRHVFQAAGPDVLPAVRRRLAIFGGAENPYRVPRPPSFAEIVGRNPRLTFAIRRVVRQLGATRTGRDASRAGPQRAAAGTTAVHGLVVHARSAPLRVLPSGRQRRSGGSGTSDTGTCREAHRPAVLAARPLPRPRSAQCPARCPPDL